MSKILLISNRIPVGDNAGGILYKQIIKAYFPNLVDIVSVSRKVKSKDIDIEIKHNYTIKEFSLRINGNNIITRILKKIDFIDYLYFKFFFFFKRKKIIDYIKELNPDKILIAMRGESIIIGDLINRELETIKIEYIGFIEDTVEREIEDNSILFYEKKLKYYRLLNNLSRVGVAGETMKKYISKTFSKDAVILRPWFPDNTERFLKREKTNSFNVFFAGNIYAKREFNFFLEALDYMGSKTKEKITFYIASHKKIKFNSSNIRIINLGWAEHDQLVGYMSKCHVGYLPYKSEGEFKHSMMYAFPGKAGLYISNGLPVFFHGPKYSSFNSFLENNYKVGFSSDELVQKEIIYELFLNHFFNIKNLTEFHTNCIMAYKKEFNESSFTRNVKKLLD